MDDDFLWKYNLMLLEEMNRIRLENDALMRDIQERNRQMENEMDRIREENRARELEIERMVRGY